MTEIIRETDADIDALEQDEEVVERGEVAIGSYKAHLSTAKKGIEEYKIWWSLTHAVLCMAAQNSYHRIDLRDIETLKKLEKDMGMEIDYEFINAEIARKPYLIRPNGEKPPVDRTKDLNGKPLTKKALKNVQRQDKVQGIIDTLKAK